MLAKHESLLLETLWREHAGAMRSFMLARTGNTVEAEDAVGEVYWRACRALARGMRPQRNPKGWIWQILHHYCIDRARRQARLPKRVDWHAPAVHRRDPGQAQTSGADWLVAVEPPNPVAIEEQAQVRAALVTLPPRQARFLILRHYHGYRLEEIATAWGISYGAAKAIHHRAITGLRARLEHESSTPFTPQANAKQE